MNLRHGEVTPLRHLLDLDCNETKEQMEQTDIQEVLEQPVVITGHVLTAVGVDSKSPKEPLLLPHLCEIGDPPLTYDGIERSKVKDAWYDSIRI